MNISTKKTGVFLFLFLSFSTLFSQGTNKDYLDYIEKYKDTAISEMNRTGIPASIKLAQSILESNAGKSTLARKAKNHFGIKCGPAWHGKKFHLEDDDFDEYGNKIKSCFRVYKSPISSFIAHSEFLRDPRKAYRYGPLFSLDPLDYQAWAYGLKEAGYATAPRYPQMLINLIETYDLAQYDHMDGVIASTDTEIDPDKPDPTNTTSHVFGRRHKLNDLKVYVANGDESVYQVAFQQNVKLKRLVKYNDGVTSGDNKLPKGYKLYLQSKRNNWRGRAIYHYVKEGETLFDISQRYGVKLRKLHRKNRIPKNAEPLVGEQIRIRGWHRRTEKVKFKVTNQPMVPLLSSKKVITKKDPKSDNPKKDNPRDGDLLDIEISPSDTPDDGDLIDVDPATTDTPSTDTIETHPSTSTDTPSTSDPIIVDDTPVVVDDTPVITNDTPVVVDDTPVITDSTPVVVDDSSTTERTYITVIKGDTLYSLARSFGLTVAELKALNGLKDNDLSIGQKLFVK